MFCVNGHPMDPGQQFCAVCGGQSAAPPAPAAPAPPAPPPAQGFGPAPQPAPEGGFGPPPGAPPPAAAAPVPPASPGVPASAQMEAQAAKWAPVRKQLLALALVAGGLLLEFSALLTAMATDHVSWKYRVQQLASPGGAVGLVGVALILAVFLASPSDDDADRAKDLGAKAGLGVLVVAGIGALTMLLAFLADLASLGDSFVGGLGLLAAHLASLLILLGAAAGAFMTRPAKT